MNRHLYQNIIRYFSELFPGVEPDKKIIRGYLDFMDFDIVVENEYPESIFDNLYKKGEEINYMKVIVKYARHVEKQKREHEEKFKPTLNTIVRTVWSNYTRI